MTQAFNEAALLADYGLEFGKPKIVMTKRGEREVRSAPATEKFWEAWRADKEAVKARGLGCSKNQDGHWEVAHWAETMSATARAAAHEASRAKDADIVIPAGAGCEFLPFQRAGIAYALQRTGTLIGDEMGLGKTVQAIGVCNAVDARRVLVVTRASLLLNWRNEILKWQTLGHPVYVIRPGLLFTGEPDGWYVINYDIAHRYEDVLKREEWDVVIFDECQDIKSRKAKRTLALVGGQLRPKGKPVENHDPIPAKKKLLLTGTPIMNRPNELYTLVHYLDPQRWGSWSGFARRYCGGQMTAHGYDATGATNLDELQARLRETVMVRRLKKDVLTELPAKVRQIITVEVDDLETKAIIERENQRHEEIEAEIAAASYAAQTAEAEGDEAAYQQAVKRLKAAQGIAFTEMAKVRHETAVAKLPAVIEHLNTVEGKCLVFAHHRDVIDRLCEALADRGVVSITGETPNEKRQPIVEQFQTNPAIQFFVGNIRAAGVGLTLTASSHVVFAELDWTPSGVSQAEDRAHRIGQRESVLVQHIVLDGSLDAKMAKMIVAKQKVIDEALDKQVAVGLVEKDEPATLVVDTAAEEQPAQPRRESRPQPDIILTPEQTAAVHAALRIVAGYDADRARDINGVGFSKMDTRFGCELAERSRLTPRQALAARKMVRKYRRQYPESIFNAMFGGTNDAGAPAA